VLEGDEPRADPQMVHRGSFLSIPTPWEGGRAMPGLASPVRLLGTEPPRRPAPTLGGDSASVLSECGFAPGEIAALRGAGALG